MFGPASGVRGGPPCLEGLGTSGLTGVLRLCQRLKSVPRLVEATWKKIMPYRFQPGEMYRMPIHFGPSLGPRRGEAGRRFANRDTPKVTAVSVSFLTNREQLEELLPEGFAVGAEPIVTVSASYITEIEWLAGRGYNTLGVSFPAVFKMLK